VEIASYRFDVAFESQHMQQLHGFDEWLDDQGRIKLLITNKPFCMVQGATAQLKTGFFIVMAQLTELPRTFLYL
jgi:hypothetical protein